MPCFRTNWAPDAAAMPGDENPATPSAPRRWGRIIAIAAMVALLALLIAIGWVSRPDRLAGLVLDRVGSALDLEITASGTSEYRLRGTPMLSVRGLVVRQPGAGDPLLTADRAYLSLPWTTLWAGGEDLTIRRVELDGPVLNLGALQAWLASRLTGEPARIPTLTKGLRVRGGQLAGDGWAVDRLGIASDRLDPAQPFAARVGGRVISGATNAPFDLQLALTRPAMNAGVGLAGIASAITPQWRLPFTLQLSGVLRDTAGGMGLDSALLGSNVRWFDLPSSAEPELEFTVGLAGRVRYRDGGLRISPLGAALRGKGDLPEQINATGSFALDDQLSLHLTGEIDEWPSGWPALPAPLADSQSPLPFVLDYEGAADLADQTRLRVSRDDVRFDGRFRVLELGPWMAQLANGTPLPPLRGTLELPRVEIAGATLTGVRLQMDDTEVDDEVDRQNPTTGK